MRRLAMFFSVLMLTGVIATATSGPAEATKAGLRYTVAVVNNCTGSGVTANASPTIAGGNRQTIGSGETGRFTMTGPGSVTVRNWLGRVIRDVDVERTAKVRYIFAC